MINFKPYADYVHHIGGIVYVNPGYDFAYVGDYLSSGEADVANIHEVDSNITNQLTSNNKFSPWQVSVIVGNISNSQEMQNDESEMAHKGIGITYMYADSYGGLPDYFADEIAHAAVTKVQSKNVLH